MIEPEILTRRYWKKVFQVIAILIGLCLLLTIAYNNGYAKASAAHRQEAARYAKVCNTLIDMGFNDFNKAVGKHILAKAGYTDVRDIALPSFDCQYSEKLSKYNPQEK